MWWPRRRRRGRSGTLLLPGVEHVMEYQVVSRGSCWGGIVGEAPVRLETGDVIAFPRGDAHVISSAPGMRGAVEPASYRAPRDNRPWPVKIDMAGDGSHPARLICGFLGCDARPFNPLLASLPRTLHRVGVSPGEWRRERRVGSARTVPWAWPAGSRLPLSVNPTAPRPNCPSLSVGPSASAARRAAAARSLRS